MRKLTYKIFIIIFLGLIFLIGVTLINRMILKYRSQSLNIILISIDTLRADHMGIYGYNKDTTPNIDKWAKNATVFTNATSVVPITYASFVALMTGQDPFKTRIANNSVISSPKAWEPWAYALPLSDNIKTLPKILKDLGYSNIGFTSTPTLNNMTNINKGFDSYFNFNWDNNTAKDSINKALYLLDYYKDKKLFFWIHLLSPHSPYEPPESLRCKFNLKYCDLKGTDESREIERRSYNSCASYETIPQDKKEIFEMLYDGEIAYTDELVKIILDNISEKGLDKNSIIILYGDHGEGFDHEEYFEHGGNVYQSNIQIPLIIKHPLIKTTDNRVDRLIQNIDIFPTLLELIGHTLKDKNSGLSSGDIFYKDIFTIFNFNTRKEAYSINSGMGKFSITSNQYKYIYNNATCSYKNYSEELYDLDKDPKEMLNLVNIKKDIAAILKSKLMDHLSQYNLPQYYNRINQNIMENNISTSNNNISLPTPIFNQDIENLKSLGY